MGWTQLYAKPTGSLKAFFAQEFRHEGYTHLDCASKLGVSYIALQRPNKSVTALVVLTRYGREGIDNTFYYKDMSEDMGPCESQCPERILKLLTPTDHPYALAWRARCQANIDKRKRAAKIGDTIRLDSPLTFVDGTEHDTFTIVAYRGHTYFQATDNRSLYRIPNWKTREYSIV